MNDIIDKKKEATESITMATHSVDKDHQVSAACNVYNMKFPKKVGLIIVNEFCERYNITFYFKFLNNKQLEK